MSIQFPLKVLTFRMEPNCIDPSVSRSSQSTTIFVLTKSNAVGSECLCTECTFIEAQENAKLSGVLGWC